jgi:branched-subunit amino acid ABC-type transport system permease component
MVVETLVNVLWSGFVQGSILAVGALGFTILFGILNFFNVAYAEYVTGGAYILLATSEAGIPIPVAVLSALVFVSLLSLAVDRAVFKPFRDRTPLTLLIVSIGVTFILRNMLRIQWGNQTRLLEFPVDGVVDIAGLRMSHEELLIVGIALVIVVAAFVIIQRTKIGIAMRGASENNDLIRVRGIDPERLTKYTVVISGFIAGVAGVLYSVNAQLNPLIGFSLLVPVFAAVIIGGVGDVRGAVFGGLSIGLIQETSVLVLSPTYKGAVALAIVIVALLVKPQGLFGETTRL